ncbi:MAG: DegT/DnrJ/EryC1/StrS family aminotransferase [Weeksellaceae bacterium]
MISTDFAPNETKNDALLSLKLLTQPWKWYKGKDSGKLKRKLKQKFFTDSANIHFFLTGRSAIYYFLKSLNLPTGSSILVQGFTCEAVVLPILAHQFNPIYVDITADDYSMDPADLKKKYTPECRVLILQHSFGITPTKRKEILQFAKAHDLVVLEDVAHGFDANLFQLKRLPTHLLLSFGRSKAFSSVFGGAIVTTSATLSSRLDEIEKTLRQPDFGFMIRLLLYKPLTYIIRSSYKLVIGKVLHKLLTAMNLLIPEITQKEKKGNYDYVFSKAYPHAAATLMLQQLQAYNDVAKRRTNIVSMYNKALELSTTETSLIRYPIRTPYRDKLRTASRRKNVFLGVWYDQVIGPKALDMGKVRYVKGSCPQAEALCEEILNLPTNITRDQAKKVIQLVNSK